MSMKKKLRINEPNARAGLLLAVAFTAALPAWAANHIVSVSGADRLVNLRTVYPAVGDTVTLPAAEEGCEYKIGNPTIAKMIDANTMEILRPGATSVAYYTGSSVATWNDCAEVVVPATPKVGGKVYVWTRTADDGSGNWNTPANWYCVTTGTSGSTFPNAVNDVAMVFLNGQRKWLQITVPTDVTVGSLWMGQVRHQYNSSDFVERFVGPGTITFQSSDGPAEFHLLGSATDGKIHTHVLGYSNDTTKRLKINLASSVEADLGWSYDGVESASNEFLQFNYVDLTVPEGKTIRFRNICPNNRGYCVHTLNFSANCKVIGAGTIINDSAATCYKGGDWSEFPGTFIEQGSGHLGYNGAANQGNTYLEKANNHPDATLVVRGFPQLATTSGGNTFHGSMTSWGNFAGFVRASGSATQNPGNRLAYKNVSLEGGFLDLCVDQKDGWEDLELVYAPGKLVASEGFSGIAVRQSTNTAHPTNILKLVDFSNAKGAMLSILEPMSANKKTSTDDVRGYVKVENFADLAIGGEGDVVATNRNYKIIPWLLSPRTFEGGYSQFYGVNADGVLVTAASRKADRLMNVADDDNAALEGEYNHLADTQRTKVNSLFLREVSKAKHWLGKRRLEVTSGGIILSRNGLIGNVGDDGVSETSNAGELYLPNRGYIWEINGDGENLDGQIWDKIVAPKGVSFAAVNKGTARVILGGDQRGIEKDVTVNAGTLQLGNDTVGCQLGDVEVRIVGATSTLKVMPGSVRGLKNTKIVFRDIGGYPAKLQLPEGETVVLKGLCREDDNGVQKALRPGVYAAEAGEGVDFVDAHLVGTARVFVPSPALVITIR